MSHFHQGHRRKPLINSQEYISLSSYINYQLSGDPINWQAVLSLVMGEKIPEVTDHFLPEALEYLDEAYGKQKRRLGPLAILHPIRTVALLAKAKGSEPLSTLDVLTALLHDKIEDIQPESYDESSWLRLEKKYQSLLDRIDANANWFLNERIHYLTRQPNQRYHQYLGNLLERSRVTPELAAIKLADRLDNTLDLRIDIHDFTEQTHCYQTIFDILFVNCYPGLQMKQPHPVSGKIDGSMRLYQLYKNAVFLSILRDLNIELDHASTRLFFALAIASIREAQSILLHIFAYHLQSPDQQRQLLMEVLQYAQEDRFSTVYDKGNRTFDGLFNKYFACEKKEDKRDRLAELYKNKHLMGQAAGGFMVTFSSFVNSEHFTIKGISSSGIVPQQ